MRFTAIQCRAARSLLGWSAADLAAAATISLMTVKRFELGQTVNEVTLSRIETALAAAGAIFIEPGEVSAAGGAGVRLV